MAGVLSTKTKGGRKSQIIAEHCRAQLFVFEEIAGFLVSCVVERAPFKDLFGGRTGGTNHRCVGNLSSALQEDLLGATKLKVYLTSLHTRM